MAIGHAVLGVLTRGRRYGYEIRRELEDEFGAAWRLDFGQLYRALSVMRRNGWVVGRVEPGRDGPARRVYAITARGRSEFRRWLRQPVEHAAHGRDELPLKVRFAMAGPPARAGELVAAQHRLLDARRRTQEQRSERAQHKSDSAAWLLAEAHRRQTDAAIAWLRSCEAVLPARPRCAPAATETRALVAGGSDDPLLEMIGRLATARHPELRFSTEIAGSLAGLVALREQRVDLAGIHLLDVDSGEYNVPFVKHVLPEERIVLLHLAQREQGLMVAARNPKEIRRLRDLLRPGVRVINRQRGAGTRLLLHHRLRQARIDPYAIAGYGSEAPTHGAVAAAVAAGAADAGPGIRAVAEAWGLEFLPLGYERYDLAIPRAVFDSRRLRPLLEAMHRKSLRRTAAAMSGYDVSHMAEIVAELR